MDIAKMNPKDFVAPDYAHLDEPKEMVKAMWDSISKYGTAIQDAAKDAPKQDPYQQAYDAYKAKLYGANQQAAQDLWIRQQASVGSVAGQATQEPTSEPEEKPIGSPKYRPIDIPRFD